MLGPTGVGFAYIKNPCQVSTLIEGGSPGSSALASVHPRQMPYKFEAGTLNGLGISGLRGALQYIQRTGWNAIVEPPLRLTQKLMDEVQRIPGLIIYGTKDCTRKVPILSLNLRGWLPSQVAYELDRRYKICTRAGLHCAPLIHKKLGTAPTGTVRISLGHQNTEEDVDLLMKALWELQDETEAQSDLNTTR